MCVRPVVRYNTVWDVRINGLCSEHFVAKKQLAVALVGELLHRQHERGISIGTSCTSVSFVCMFSTRSGVTQFYRHGSQLEPTFVDLKENIIIGLGHSAKK